MRSGLQCAAKGIGFQDKKRPGPRLRPTVGVIAARIAEFVPDVRSSICSLCPYQNLSSRRLLPSQSRHIMISSPRLGVSNGYLVLGEDDADEVPV